MNIRKTPGIFYDMITYSIIFFDREAVLRKFQAVGMTSEFFNDYEVVYELCGHIAPPPELYPLFCLYMGRASVMSDYFDAEFDFFSDTPETYFARLKNSVEFRRYIYTYYLSDFGDQISIDSVIDGDSESISHALAPLALRVRIDAFLDIIYHFDGVVDSLIEYFGRLRPFIKSYHEKNIKRYDVAQDFIRIKNEAVLKKICSGTDRAELFTFSVSMINKRLVMRQGEPVQNIYAYILGYDCIAALSESIDYSYMTARGVLDVIGDGLSADIITQLCKKDMTVSQLARCMHISRSSLVKGIDSLCNELVIMRRRMKNAEVYCHLNRIYMQHAKVLIDEYLDRCIEGPS